MSLDSHTQPVTFVPMPHRDPLQLPDNNHLALWVVLNVEWFPLSTTLAGDPTDNLDLPTWGSRDYGARVGIWRMLDVFREYGVKLSIALNSKVCEAYPAIIQALVEADVEFMGHNETNVRRLTSMSAGEHDESVHRVLDKIEAATGQRPRGWLSAGMQEQTRTLEVLADAGVEYVADWLNDDQPYWFNLPGREMISVPYATETNDRMAIDRRGLSTEEFVEVSKRQFDVLLEEGASSARVLALCLHPFLMGVPHRMPFLREILDHYQAAQGVWWTTGIDIARWFRESTGGPEA